jgi:phosphatidylinositol-binding clathrin assembly protein
MFNPHTNRYVLCTRQRPPLIIRKPSPNTTYFQQQSTSNPFHLMGVSAQPTGFVQPQPTAFQQPQQLLPQPTGHRPFSSFIPPQATGLLGQPPMPSMAPMLTTGGLLQPQMTGSNPFRQSMLMPQTTGMQMFGVGVPTSLANGQGNFPQAPGQPFSAGVVAAPTGIPSITTNAFSQSPFVGSQITGITSPISIPPRPASTPLTKLGSTSSTTSPPIAQPVKTHVTGTKNPFGPVATAAPPVPRQPTLFELTMAKTDGPMSGQEQTQTLSFLHQSQRENTAGKPSGFSLASSALAPGATDMGSVASSFVFNSNPSTNNPIGVSNNSSLTTSNNLTAQHTAATSFSGSTVSDSLLSSNLSSQSTGATSLSSSAFSAPSPGVLRPTLTGFNGIKPFKPSSSFGASLMENLPPIPGSAPTTPGVASGPTQPSPTGGLFPPGGATTSSALLNGAAPSLTSTTIGKPIGSTLSSQPTGFATLGTFNSTSTLGVGLRPQMTGGPNPFRASMAINAMPTGLGGLGGGLSSTTSALPSNIGGVGALNANPGSSLTGAPSLFATNGAPSSQQQLNHNAPLF